ncbi:alpha/beta hydrolase family protein [Streptomyces sp. NPDC057621]|uniref:alpha/beta hydrolase family protein n=1 Tax=Streptomyces sp. NPDC057621 TaxID=3346186 RepID=UPI0036D11FC1
MTTHTSPENETLLQQAFSLWTPRLLLGGVAYADFQRAATLTESWADWIHVWSELGAEHRTTAERFEAEGATVSAGESYRLAGACYHFAKFVWVDDEAKNGVATAHAVEAIRHSLRLLDPGHRIVSAERDGVRIAANVRVPKGVDGPCPVVVLVPGLDSTKEEFTTWEETFLARGLATMSVDGPGQGEVFHAGTRLGPRYEEAVSLALDTIADDPRLDLERVGLAGTSLGGWYVARAAAFESRVRALVSISGPSRIDYDASPSHSRASLRFYSRAGSDEDTRRHLLGFDCAEFIGRVAQPALFTTGRKDRIVPWDQTVALAQGAPHGEFFGYESGNHGLTNVAYESRPRTADWLKHRLTAL